MNKIIYIAIITMPIVSVCTYAMQQKHEQKEYVSLTDNGGEKVSEREILHWWSEENQKGEFGIRCPICTQQGNPQDKDIQFLQCHYHISGSKTFVYEKLIEHIVNYHKNDNCPKYLCKKNAQDKDFGKHVVDHTDIAKYLGFIA